jgi:hypothetical protein
MEVNIRFDEDNINFMRVDTATWLFPIPDKYVSLVKKY